MSNTLEWNTRSGYALTELVLFIITALIVCVAVSLSFLLPFLHATTNVSFFSTLRPLFENVLPSAIAFTVVEKSPRSRKGKVNVVFLGYQERNLIQRQNRLNLVRTWVHVYFILLCGLIMLWAVAVFSDSVLYKKSSSCTDLSLEDTDLSCFLLSSRDIPEGVQQIIDEEEGELVPCERVQEYIQSQNISLDLEVICYQYLLNPLTALGISYGAMKTIAFAIITTLSIILNITNKFRGRLFQDATNISSLFQPNDYTDFNSAKVITRTTIAVAHVLQIILSICIISIIAVVLAILHNNISETENSGLDYLRGEQFYRYSVTVLVPITIVFILGLFPWWAFKPLGHPPKLKGSDLTDKEVTSKMHHFVHNAILHHKFSTGFASLMEDVAALEESKHCEELSDTAVAEHAQGE